MFSSCKKKVHFKKSIFLSSVSSNLLQFLSSMSFSSVPPEYDEDLTEIPTSDTGKACLSSLLTRHPGQQPVLRTKAGARVRPSAPAPRHRGQREHVECVVLSQPHLTSSGRGCCSRPSQTGHRKDGEQQGRRRVGWKAVCPGRLRAVAGGTRAWMEPVYVWTIDAVTCHQPRGPGWLLSHAVCTLMT